MKWHKKKRREHKAMLIGEYFHNLDTKGRVSIPSKFRDDLGGTFVLSKGVNDCLCAYSTEEWDAFKEELLALKGAEARKLRRFFFAGATECEIDSQGRVVIPPGYREYANLSREVVIVGVSNCMEIWNKEAWTEYMDDTSLDSKEIEDAMERLGL